MQLLALAKTKIMIINIFGLMSVKSVIPPILYSAESRVLQEKCTRVRAATTANFPYRYNTDSDRFPDLYLLVHKRILNMRALA